MNNNHLIESCEGNVERITFHSEQSGFCVIRVKSKKHRDLVTITGNTASINIGEFIEAKGNWINDKNYGQQFKASNIKIIPPSTIEGITKYLGSGMIKGIGPVFGKKLVSAFGLDIFNVIEDHPEKLLSLDGIGKKRVHKITSAWVEQKEIRNIMVFLQSHGIGTARSVRIYKTYGEKSIDRIKENPYCLASDIHGIGFKTADELGEKLGIPKDSIVRAKAGVVHCLQQMTNDGHCAVFNTDLIVASSNMLDINDSIIIDAIEEEVQEEKLIKDIIEEKDCLYINWLYYAEVGIAQNIARLIKTNPSWGNINIDKALSWVQNHTGLKLSESQYLAVESAIKSKFICITGGPGVGKTTVVNSIIKIIKRRNSTVTLCAPTGRAAKRLSESTGLESKTIHRLLEFSPQNGGFVRNDNNQLETDLLVIDEASMVDTILMNALLKSVPDHAGVLIVGDIDQLPSVGAGSVLSDIISSEKILTVRLTEIFRQAATSQIIVNAHRINQGKAPFKTKKGEKTDFFVVHSEDVEDIHSKIIKIITDKIPNIFKKNPILDTQILTPMNRGGLGVKSLNIEIQKHLNPNPIASITKYGWSFGVGDKVVQTINNYDKDIFNGDLGIIQSVDHIESEVKINFDNNLVNYDFNELDELSLAYATSIHKSQGSEYPIVIIPLAMQHYMLLQKNLIYTGVTRGKEIVILIVEPKALYMGVKNSTQSKRLTKLKQRIKEI